MSSELDYQPTDTSGLDTAVSEKVAARVTASVPHETRRAYGGDWTRFTAWCAATGRTALPATPETLAEYGSTLADQNKAPATIMRATASIRAVHRLNSLTPPETTVLRAVVKSYRTERASRGLPNERRAASLSVRDLRTLAGQLDTTDAIALRDRAILVLGWAMMARRGELVALDLADITEVHQGLEITVRRSKTDQHATGRTVAVPYGSDPATCPVRLLRAWTALLAEHGRTTGPLFVRIDRWGNIGAPIKRHGQPIGDPEGRLTGEAVGDILKKTAERAGLDPRALRAHSLRAGGVTGAYLAGADLVSIGRHGGWHDGSTVLLRYIRDVDRWQKNPMHGAGL